MRPTLDRLRAVPIPGVLLLLLACGGDDDAALSSTGDPPEPTSCAQADASACRVDQKACVLEAGAPVCTPCERGQYVTQAGACAPIGGQAMTHVFADFTTQPGEEVLGLCQSWTLGNETEIWVNAVELVQGQQSHHSNWTFSPEDRFPGPDGVWDCDERDYDQLSAAVSGGVIYAQSTQAPREVQKFPDGAAVRIPPRSRIIGDVHLLNVTSEPATGHAELTLYVVPPEEVAVGLAPFHLTYDTLAIPPHARSRFSGTCELAQDWQATTGGPVAMKLYYALPHTHALGRRFFLQASGGPRDGEMLLDVQGFNGEARGTYYEPPVDLAGITGLTFGCEFDNPRDEVVEWGFGDQEMCEMLGFIEAPVAFESRIQEVVPAGTDGDMPLFTGACSNLLLPWDQKQ
jgi:hypothetical protein